MPATAARSTKKSAKAKTSSAKRTTARGKKTVSAKRTSKSATARKSSTSVAARKTSRSKAVRKTTTRSAAAGTRSKVARRTAAGTSQAKKRTPNAAFMKPMQPDSALSAIVGSRPLPRPQVTKKLWAYIKKNGLQDATKRTMINADSALKVVFGGKRKVDMFQMTKLVSRRLHDVT